MSDDTQRKMQTRSSRRSALADISNKTGQSNQGAAGKGANAARSKRMVRLPPLSARNESDLTESETMNREQV
jgi:hypothetical protein